MFLNFLHLSKGMLEINFNVRLTNFGLNCIGKIWVLISFYLKNNINLIGKFNTLLSTCDTKFQLYLKELKKFLFNSKHDLKVNRRLLGYVLCIKSFEFS